MKYKLTFRDNQDATNTTERIVDAAQIGDIVSKAAKDNWTLIGNEATEIEPAKADLANITARKNPYEKNSWNAFGRGLGQGALYNWTDELSDNKEVERAKNTLAQEGSPVAYGAGEWLGSIPAEIGATIAGGRVFKSIAPMLANSPALLKTATNPAIRSVASGAAEGALSGAGVAEEGQKTEGAGKGAIIGSAFSMAGNKIANKLGLDSTAAANQISDELISKLTPDARQQFEDKFKEQLIEEGRAKFGTSKTIPDWLRELTWSPEMHRLKKDKEVLTKGMEGSLKGDDLYSPAELKLRKDIEQKKIDLEEKQAKMNMYVDQPDMSQTSVVPFTSRRQSASTEQLPQDIAITRTSSRGQPLPEEYMTKQTVELGGIPIPDRYLKSNEINNINAREASKLLRQQENDLNFIDLLRSSENYTPDAVLDTRAEIFNDILSSKYQSLLSDKIKQDLQQTAGKYQSKPVESLVNRSIQPAVSTILQKDFTLPQPLGQLLTPKEEVKRLEEQKVKSALTVLFEAGLIDPVTGELK
jgi:hypothetical protein